ncbi:multidrug effflux MFS transporter [Stackebrandtia soli]|uniref:multidrug effflux MFS transporter n=1 Tax=Stackebrandtia soli TaxID=1892856 RepID=UPI0039EC8DFC
MDRPAVGTARPQRSMVMLVLVLGTLTAVGPLATDLYLPAFPAIAGDLGATESQISLTLTAAMVGLAVGQLVIGPMSDAWGRRTPLLIGVIAFTVSSVLCMFVPDATSFIALRFVQGIAGAAGAVISRAIARDHFDGDSIARFFSRLVLVSMLAPLLGPVIGAQLLLVGPWQLGFAVLAAVSALSLVLIYFFLPESLPAHERRPMNGRQLFTTIGGLLRDARFIGPTLTLGLGFGMMFTYIANFSFVSQNQFGASAQEFSAMFAINTVGLLLGTQINAFLIGKVSTSRRLAGGLIGAIAAVAALAVLDVTGTASLVSMTAAFFIMMLSNGFIFPNASTMSLASQPPAVAGTASALMGTLQFALGGGLSAAATLTKSGQVSLDSMVVVMLAVAVAAGAVFVYSQRRAARYAI